MVVFKVYAINGVNRLWRRFYGVKGKEENTIYENVKFIPLLFLPRKKYSILVV